MQHTGKVRLAALNAIAVLEDGTHVYPICGADEGPEEDSTGDGGDGTGEESEEDGGEEESEEDSKDPKVSKTIRKLKDEQAQRRIANKKLQQDLEAATEELRKLKLKDASEVEQLKSELEVATKKLAALDSKHKDALIEREALRVSPKLKLAWRDNDDVLGWLARAEGVSVTDDGEITGVEDALKELAKKKPHWLSESEKDGKKQDRKPTGPTGASFNGNGNDRSKDTSRQALEKKYPALRGRG